MPARIDKVPGERSYRVRPQPPAVDSIGEEDVDTRPAKLGVVLFLVLDESDEVAALLDRKPLWVSARAGLLSQFGHIWRPPPASDPGFGLD